MKSFSLSAKLVLGMSIPLTILVVSMVSLVVLVGLVREKVSHSREHSLVLAATAHRMQLSAVQVQQFLTDISATRAKDGLDDGFKEAAEYHDKFLAGVAQFRAEFQATGETEQLQSLERIAATFEEYYAVGKRMAEAYIAGGPEQGNKVMPDFDAKAKQLTAALEPFIAAQAEELTTAIGSVEARTVLLRDVVLWCGSGAILLSLGLMVLTNRAISGPILRIVESLEASAAETAAAAGELAGASHQQADGAVAQSAALDRSEVTLQAMSEATHRGVENTKSVGELIHGARLSADAGTEDLQALSTTMDEIRQSSQDISAIIKSMDEIAFQTNILALNAAVEAARAGEAGAGFAVVADEVRNLAQRSAAAAKESSAKIALAMAKAAQGKEDNVKVVRRIEEILGKVREVDGLMTEFSTATTEQHASIEKVVQGLRDIDRITHDSAAQAEESASAAAELNSQAGALRTAVHDLELMVAGRATRRLLPGADDNPVLRGRSVPAAPRRVAVEV